MKTSRSSSFHTALRVTNAATFLFSSAAAFFLLFPIYLQQSGSSPAQIGLVAGLLRISSLVARPLAGRLLDQFGRRSVISIGAGLATVAILSLFVFPQVSAVFLIMRVLQGFGTSLVDCGLSALVADLSPPGSRVRVFAIYTVWISLANAVMPGAGEMLARQAGFYPLFGVAALVLGGGIALVSRLPETAPHRQDHAEPLRGLMAGGAPILLGGMLVGLAYGVLSVFVPVARIAAAPGRAGIFFFAYFVGLIAVRLAGGLGLNWLAQPKILLPAYGVLTAGLAALPLGDSAALLVGVGLGCGASHGAVMPVLYGLLLFGMSRQRRGWGVALMAAAFDLGNVVGVMGLGLAAEHLGYGGIFVLAAGTVAVGAVVSHLLSRC